MRVIKEGHAHEVKITCPRCQSVLMYTPADLRKRLSYPYETHYDIFISCPRCGRIIIRDTLVYEPFCRDIPKG